jgi:hypothetical protein
MALLLQLRQQTQVRIFASFLNKNNQQQQQQQQQNTTTTSIPSISTTSNTNKELTTNDSKITKQQQHPTLLNSYLTLAKARLSALVVTTTAAGYLASGTFALTTFSACIVGTALCSASAAALNQLLEKDRDARMRRTQLRPLVTGALSKQQAAVAATAWGMAGAGILYVGTDPLTMSLGVANLALYAGVYTYMKPRSIYNTWMDGSDGWKLRGRGTNGFGCDLVFVANATLFCIELLQSRGLPARWFCHGTLSRRRWSRDC